MISFTYLSAALNSKPLGFCIGRTQKRELGAGLSDAGGVGGRGGVEAGVALLHVVECECVQRVVLRDVHSPLRPTAAAAAAEHLPIVFPNDARLRFSDHLTSELCVLASVKLHRSDSYCELWGVGRCLS